MSKLVMLLLVVLGSFQAEAQMRPRPPGGGGGPNMCVPPSQPNILRAFCNGDNCNPGRLQSEAQSLLQRGRGSLTLSVNQDGRGNYTEVVLDLGQLRAIEFVSLQGRSSGHWCEDGQKSPEAAATWCHNDNNIGIEVSANGRDFHALRNLQGCAWLDNGCSFSAAGLGARYVKLASSSSCGGCINTDVITSIDIQ